MVGGLGLESKPGRIVQNAAHNGSALDTCTTMDGVACVLPFTYLGKSYVALIEP